MQSPISNLLLYNLHNTSLNLIGSDPDASGFLTCFTLKTKEDGVEPDTEVAPFNSTELFEMLYRLWKKDNVQNNNSEHSTHVSNKTTYGIESFWVNEEQLTTGKTETSSSNFRTWLFQHALFSNESVQVSTVVRTERIDEKYRDMELEQGAVVYWVSDDEFKDVFVSSVGQKGYQMQLSHNASLSSIHLASDIFQ